MDPPGSTRTDARNGSDLAAAEANSSSVVVPLLLNPVYARTKSIVHDELRNFRICLKWCALDHSSPSGRAASYAVFVALAVVLPAATSFSVRSPPSAAAIPLNKLVQLPTSGLAAMSFLTLAAFFRQHGLRQLLFLDGALRDDSAFVRCGYDRKLDRAFRHLAVILLPSFSVEVAHKILFFSSVSVSDRLPFQAPIPWNSVAFVATLASWVYCTGVFLLVCVLFRLTCELQILRFEGFYRMFEEEEEEEGGLPGEKRSGREGDCRRGEPLPVGRRKRRRRRREGELPRENGAAGGRGSCRERDGEWPGERGVAGRRLPEGDATAWGVDRTGMEAWGGKSGGAPAGK